MNTELDDVLQTLARTAAERDRLGGHAAAEKALLRGLGLLRAAIPVRFGGQEQPWPAIFDTVRRVAQVDSALAHVLAFHHLQVATVLIYADEAQQRRWLSATAEQGLWWGNAMNPRDARLRVSHRGDDFELNGVKSFCSGTVGSSLMTLSATPDEGGQMLLGVVATGHPGIRILDDWNPIGQRQTDSNSVSFERVPLPGIDVIRQVEAAATPWHSLRSCFGQLVLVNLYVGMAQGALAQARSYVIGEGRPWLYSEAATAADDPFTQNRFGDMYVQVQAAVAMADRAADAIQQAWIRGAELDTDQRGRTSLAVAEAKVIAHRAALFVGQEMFEAIGARGTDAARAFDRFWRNARTHTLHDPIDYKLNVLGRWALKDELPPASLYN